MFHTGSKTITVCSNLIQQRLIIDTELKWSYMWIEYNFLACVLINICKPAIFVIQIILFSDIQYFCSIWKQLIQLFFDFKDSLNIPSSNNWCTIKSGLYVCMPACLGGRDLLSDKHGKLWVFVFAFLNDCVSSQFLI